MERVGRLGVGGAPDDQRHMTWLEQIAITDADLSAGPRRRAIFAP
jgi:hypothetical protein